ncbi:MAG TPA: hypothetical protein VFZ09_03580 [Archangium sp.]|uniref:hypothetical protein n=1 Tax=Archangium sp. TaxID=1872627 RepID=UPI002E361059|nr:hypothetical protein [Archangium sp.]HEX5745298.1 hypothetical protein [Archangium sp.]
MAEDHALVARKLPDGDNLGTFLVVLALSGSINTGQARAWSRRTSGQQLSATAPPQHVRALSCSWLGSRSTCSFPTRTGAEVQHVHPSW